MPKITALPAATAAAPDDIVPGNDDSASSTKKFSLTVIKEWLQSLTAWISAAMIAGIDKSLLTTDSNPYKFRAYRSAAWTTGTPSKVAFDAESFDTNNNFDSTTNHRYVAPVSGFYQFNVVVSSSNTSGQGLSLDFYKNGVRASFLGAFVNGNNSWVCAVGGGDVLQLAAGDYVEVFYYGSGAAGVAGQDVTWFSGFLVSRT